MEEKGTALRTGQKVSLLWVVVMFTMVFADILSFMLPGTLQEAAAMKVTQPLLLVFALLLEIPIAMIFLSRIPEVQGVAREYLEYAWNTHSLFRRTGLQIAAC